MSKSSTITSGVATPNRLTTHPGEVLSEEFLKPLDLSVNALALALRVPATRIAAIIKCERAVTADTALQLARFFRTSPEFWMNLRLCTISPKPAWSMAPLSSAISIRARPDNRRTSNDHR